MRIRKPDYLALLMVMVAVVLLPHGLAQATDSTPDFLGFLKAFLATTFDNLVSFAFSFGSGAFPAIVVGWVADQIVQRLPFLAPFRDMIQQWVLSRLEELKRDRATRAALYAGHAMELEKADLMQNGELTEQEKGEVDGYLKDLRNQRAASVLVANRTVRNTQQAHELLTSVVAELKSKGVNP